MVANAPKLTLDETNQLRIICPIFHAETPIAACFKLRELVWRGDKPPQRQGCQACMRAGKCPINNILWNIIRKPELDPYGSRTMKTVTLAQEDLNRIARVIVPESTMNRYDLSDKERLMIERANATAGSGVLTKSKKSVGVVEHVPNEPADLTVTTSDYAAAINAAIQEDA